MGDRGRAWGCCSPPAPHCGSSQKARPPSPTPGMCPGGLFLSPPHPGTMGPPDSCPSSSSQIRLLAPNSLSPPSPVPAPIPSQMPAIGDLLERPFPRHGVPGTAMCPERSQNHPPLVTEARGSPGCCCVFKAHVTGTSQVLARTECHCVCLTGPPSACDTDAGFLLWGRWERKFLLKKKIHKRKGSLLKQPGSAKYVGG